jgi:hypothetical protein
MQIINTIEVVCYYCGKPLSVEYPGPKFENGKWIIKVLPICENCLSQRKNPSEQDKCMSQMIVCDKQRYCEREKGHLGKHGTVYCGRWVYWSD